MTSRKLRVGFSALISKAFAGLPLPVFRVIILPRFDWYSKGNGAAWEERKDSSFARRAKLAVVVIVQQEDCCARPEVANKTRARTRNMIFFLMTLKGYKTIVKVTVKLVK